MKKILPEMNMAFEVTGAKKCSYPCCNTFDFLPFQCPGCNKVFCSVHREFKSHECISPPIDKYVTGSIKNQKNNNLYKCSVKGCKKKDYHKNLCNGCGKHHCFKHRYYSDHQCTKLSLSNKKIN